METPKSNRWGNEIVQMDQVEVSSRGIFEISYPIRKFGVCKEKGRHGCVDEEVVVISDKLTELENRRENLPTFIVEDGYPFFYCNVSRIHYDIINVQNNNRVSQIAAGNDTFCNYLDYEHDHYVSERELEEKYPLRGNFLENHSVRPDWRESVLLYMITVCDFLRLPADILHQAVSIFDRFLQTVKDIPTECLRLIAIGTLRISLKLFHRQNDLPFTSELLILLNFLHSPNHVFAVEKKICSVLEFNLVYPTSLSFLSRLNKISYASVLQRYLGMYLLEILFLNYSTCNLKPSLQAAAASCLSAALLENPSRDIRNIWTQYMERSSSFTLADLRPVFRLIVQSLLVISKVGEASLLYVKYAQSANFKISTFQQVRDPMILSKFL